MFGLGRCTTEEEPHVTRPVMEVATLRDVVAVENSHKCGKFISGYRIVTSQYVWISDHGGLNGQDGIGLAGPGTVPRGIANSFAVAHCLARNAYDHGETVTLYGNKTDVEFKGQPVVLLHALGVGDQVVVIDRRKFSNR